MNICVQLAGGGGRLPGGAFRVSSARGSMLRALLCDNPGVPAHTETSRPPWCSAPTMARAGARLAVASLLHTPRVRAVVRPSDTCLPLSMMGRLQNFQWACFRIDRVVPLDPDGPIWVQGWHGTPGRFRHRRLEHADGGILRDPRQRRTNQERCMGCSRIFERYTINGHGLFPFYAILCASLALYAC